MIESELINNITDETIRPAIFQQAADIAVDPAAIADAVTYAINQPEEVAVNELIIRPSAEV